MFSVTAKKIGLWEEKKNVRKLIKALRNKDRNIRCLAADALGNIGDSQAVEQLLESALKDIDQYVWSAAFFSLGKIDDSQAMKALVNILKDKTQIRRCKAAKALGMIGDSRVVESLVEALKDENIDVRCEAINSLAKFRCARAILAVIDAEKAEGKFSDNQDIEQLRNDLKGKMTEVRLRAVRCLFRIGDSRTVKPLIEALNDETDHVSSLGCIALAHIGVPEAIPPMLSYLSSKLLDHKHFDKSDFVKLFGDYASIILDLFTYGTSTERTKGMTKYNRSFDKSNKALVEFCKLDTSISSNILHLVLNRKDMQVLSATWHDADDHPLYENLSFENQRKIASEELRKRGNPAYDESLYFNIELWKL